jgi:hypothetical protein
LLLLAALEHLLEELELGGCEGEEEQEGGEEGEARACHVAAVDDGRIFQYELREENGN